MFSKGAFTRLGAVLYSLFSKLKGSDAEKRKTKKVIFGRSVFHIEWGSPKTRRVRLQQDILIDCCGREHRSVDKIDIKIIRIFLVNLRFG